MISYDVLCTYFSFIIIIINIIAFGMAFIVLMQEQYTHLTIIFKAISGEFHTS